MEQILVCFFESNLIPNEFTKFSDLALWQLINRNNAKNLLKKIILNIFIKGNGQGLVGAIGAIGYDFDDHTLELIELSKRQKIWKRTKTFNKKRKIMQEKTYPQYFQ